MNVHNVVKCVNSEMESSKLPLKAFVDLEWLMDLVYDH